MKIPPHLIKHFENIAILKHQIGLSYLNISSHLRHRCFLGISSYFNGKCNEKLSACNQITDYLAVRGVTFNFNQISPEEVSKEKMVDLFEYCNNAEERVFKELTDAAIHAKNEGDIKSFDYLQELVVKAHSSLENAEQNLKIARSYEAIPGFYFHLDETIK